MDDRLETLCTTALRGAGQWLAAKNTKGWAVSMVLMKCNLLVWNRTSALECCGTLGESCNTYTLGFEGRVR